MNLDLPDIGATPRIITCTIEGFLEPDDLLALTAPKGEAAQAADGTIIPPQPAADPTDLKRIRERHHGVARLIAQGMTQSLVASICGYTESYLSILLNNPAMEELVDMYRSQHGSVAQVIGERLRQVSKALEKLNDKLEAGSVEDVHELTAIAKLGLDRAGHGPASTKHVIEETHLIDHARIMELNAAAKASSSQYIVPMRDVRNVLPATLPAPTAPTPSEDPAHADD